MTTTTVNPNALMAAAVEAALAASNFATEVFTDKATPRSHGAVRYAWAALALLAAGSVLSAGATWHVAANTPRRS